MINFNCNIKVKHNFKNINAIVQKLPQTAKIITEDVLKNIRGYAIKLEKEHNEERYNMRTSRYFKYGGKTVVFMQAPISL